MLMKSDKNTWNVHVYRNPTYLHVKEARICGLIATLQSFEPPNIFQLQFKEGRLCGPIATVQFFKLQYIFQLQFKGLTRRDWST